jgi:hypothetical protein
MLKRISHRGVVVAVVTAAILAATAGPAAASKSSNWPLAQLDAASSAVAGHPVQVWCEGSWGDWIHLGDSVGVDFGTVFGFTNLDDPVIYINPDKCETLHALVSNYDVGTYHASIAILTLAHESVHQRGISDEGVTDCTALPLVPDLAVNYFGYPETVAQTKIVSYTKTVVKRVNGKRVTIKVRAQKAVKVTVANPELAWLAEDALAWHRSLPAEYQGTC